jgi:hypothetical protein
MAHTLDSLRRRLAQPQPNRRQSAAVASAVAADAAAEANKLIPAGITDWVRWAWSGAEVTHDFHQFDLLSEEAARKASILG